MIRPLVFTDLDGTLLDRATYSWQPALPALQLLRSHNVPVIFCSSKTRSEIEHYRRELANQHPFISENGGGIFIPEGYFGGVAFPSPLPLVTESGYVVIRIGTPYSELRRTLVGLRAEGFALTGFGDLTAADVAELTGLTLAQAGRAKERHFDEPFLFAGTLAEIAELDARIRANGLCMTRGGGFFHLLGKNDKGVAVDLLVNLYRAASGAPTIIALGDAANDLPMLQRADYPVAIRRPDGSHDPGLVLAQPLKTVAVGPAGWSEAILRLFGCAP